MLAILKLVPATAWLYIAFVLFGGAFIAYEHHKVYDEGVASQQAKVDAANLRATQAEAANQNTAATIAQLQASQVQCESGRLADQTAATKALAGQDQAAALIHKQLLADKAAVQALFDKTKNAECADWANKPACAP